jgi:two-component system chemotaxis response regulator CheY
MMKILIVDDSNTMRRVLNMGISKIETDIDFEILEASDGKEGLEIVRANKDIDYIFLDVNMPVMKGDEMLKIMRADPEIKHIKVIMQTTEGVREKVAELTKMGISGYLLKPYTQEIIIALMQKLLEKDKAVA